MEHSDNLDSKGRLGKLERQLAGASVGRTRDVLLAQIREVNQVMRELQKYSHHVTLFTQAGTAASPAAALPGQRACRRRWSLSACSIGRWLSSWPSLGKWRQAWKGWMAKLRNLQGEVRDRDKQFHLELPPSCNSTKMCNHFLTSRPQQK